MNHQKKGCFEKKRFSISLSGLLFITAIFSFVAPWSAIGQNRTKSLPIASLPLNIPVVRPLLDLRNPKLQSDLIREVGSHPRWNNLVKNGKMAVGVVDLRNLNQIRYASLNGEEMMYAASLPKIAILLAAMDALEKGELNDNVDIWKDMRLMIANSNNQASTRMIDRLGYEKIESVLSSPQYGLYDENHGGGLWVGKRYAASGLRHPDPIKGLSHAATADQVCRFYYLLAHGKLVSRDRSIQMLKIMSTPHLHHKFVNYLQNTTSLASIYRKSGTWQNFHSDSVLVWSPKRKYILVSLVQDNSGEQILRELVRSIDKVLGIST